MTTFVDTSVWFAAANIRETRNQDAKAILSAIDAVLTDHVLVEAWLLLNNRINRQAADQFWSSLRNGAARIEKVTAADLELAWTIGQAFPDQDFSLVDRTSFAVMERLGITQVASFDHHFAVYRYGPARGQAFEIVRSGHSPTFRLFHQAILAQQQIVCVYNGRRREICPYILGHSGGEEKALVFQFGGASASRLPQGGEWRCLRLAEVTDVELRSGPWHGGSRHRSRQRCVDVVYIDVNTDVPNQPGRA